MGNGNRTTDLLKLLVLAALVMPLAGCLHAEKRQYSRYDAEADAFEHLTVFLDIYGNDKKEHAHLVKLWGLREDLVLYDETLGVTNVISNIGMEDLSLDVFDVSCILREDGKDAVLIKLGDPDGGSSEPVFTSVDWDDVTVNAGSFFLDEGSLCYYHTVTLPGKAIDAMLVELQEKMCTNLVSEVAAELARREKGGKRLPWDEVRRITLRQMEEKEEEEDSGPPLTWLSEESLGLLRKAADEGTIVLRRDKGTFQFALPLDQEDRVQAVAFLKSVRDAARHRIEEARSEEKITAGQRALALASLGSVQFREEGGTCVITVDITRTRFGDWPREKSADNAKKAAKIPPQRQATVAALKAEKIPVDETLTLTGIVEDFEAGN